MIDELSFSVPSRYIVPAKVVLCRRKEGCTGLDEILHRIYIAIFRGHVHDVDNQTSQDSDVDDSCIQR